MKGLDFFGERLCQAQSLKHSLCVRTSLLDAGRRDPRCNLQHSPTSMTSS